MAETACNTCLPTCMFELIGFCNIRPSPWPMKTLLSLGSAGQDLLHFSFAPPCLGKQQLPLTFDLWVSILWAAYKLNQIQMTLEVVQCWFGFRSHCWCCFFWKHLIMILLYGRSDLFCNIWVTEEVHAVHLMRWSTVYCRVGYGNTLRLILVLKQSQSLTRNTGGVLTENVLVWLITYSSFSAAYYRLLYRSSVSHSLANQF